MLSFNSTFLFSIAGYGFVFLSLTGLTILRARQLRAAKLLRTAKLLRGSTH